MRMYDIIKKKRDGRALAAGEISFFIKEYISGNIPDYQASALLMAIYFNGMNTEETVALTQAMFNSGDKINLSSIPGIKVDKHSTGGVGDKTSLVLAPLVAAAGVPVAKMSGRGLGHTGGTIDKLEAIKGFSVNISEQQFLFNVKSIGMAICGQTANLVPADKKLYALRDVTATVENPSLIAASIMSKKMASGADAIVLDVKAGSGAFNKTPEAAFSLAEKMVEIGESMGKRTVAIISDMEQPLGNAVGNALEVKEAIDTLKGNGPEDLKQLCLELGAHMLVLGKKADSHAEAKGMLQEILASGKALEKFKEFIKAQGGDIQQVEDVSLLPKAEHIIELKAPQNGFIAGIDAEIVGLSSMLSGAGRENKESQIDLSAGIELFRKVGAQIKKGDILAAIHSSDKKKAEHAMEQIALAYRFSEKALPDRKLILGVVERTN